MKQKYTYQELIDMDVIDLYKAVLRGDISRFIPNFWSKPEALISSSILTRYLIEHILQYSDEDIKLKVNNRTFKKYKLSGMLAIVFNNSVYDAINNAYPNKFKPWELANTPINYWTLEIAKDAMHWLFEEKLKWNYDDIKNHYSCSTLCDNGLQGMVLALFNGSPYKAINNAYPNEFHQWEFINTPRNFWTKDNIALALRWLIEEKLKWNIEDVPHKFCTKVLEDNGLKSLLHNQNIALFDLINLAYPNKFKPTDLLRKPCNYWSKESSRLAVIDLIDNKLCLTEEDIKQKVTKTFFAQNGLAGMLAVVFNNSTYLAIENAYPGRFKKSDLIGYK